MIRSAASCSRVELVSHDPDWRPDDGAPILAIEASTYAASVALVRDGRVIAARDAAMRGEREERLMPAVADVLAEAGQEARALGAIVCGSGPGSFTSLRIAASIAKGLAMATHVPLIAVPSPALLLLAAAGSLAPGRYVVALDAMRDEWFVSPFELADDGRVRGIGSMTLIARADLDACAASMDGAPIGPGLARDARPDARGAACLGRAMPMPPAVDLARWEPDYGRLAEAQVKWERAHGRPLEGASDVG